MFQRHSVVLFYLQISFVLINTVTTTLNGNVSSLHQSYAMTLDVSNHHLCIHNPTVKCTEPGPLLRDSTTTDCSRQVRQTKVSEVVMGVYPRCHRNQYYIEALWDATNSGYRIESWYGKHLDYEEVICKSLNMTKARFREEKQSQYTIMVMTERLGQLPFLSTQFNFDVRASIQPQGEQVIYAAYNSTNGRGNCNQKYVPLRSGVITSEIGQSADEMHQLTISWNEQNNSNGYIVAIGDEKCTTMNRNPPCKFVKNNTKVSFGLPSSSELNGMKVRIYNTINYDCSDDEIGNELVHLFRGCVEDCCGDSTYYYTVTLPPSTTTKEMESTTSTDSTTDSNTTNQPTFPNDYLNQSTTKHPPMGVQDTTASHTSTKMQDPIAKEPNAIDPENHFFKATIIMVCILSSVFLIKVIIMVILVVLVARRYKLRNSGFYIRK